MKIWASQRVNVIKLCAALISLVCISFAFWQWDQASILPNLVPPLEQLNIPSQVNHLRPSSPAFLHNWKRYFNENVSFERRGYEKTEPVSTVQGTGFSPRSSYGKERYTKKIPLQTKGCFYGYFEYLMLAPRTDGESIYIYRDEEGGCNYAKGQWVEDNKRPLYSGSGCKQWLSGMWACRLTRRTDFSYEHFRWQPQGCEMPNFSGPEFLKRMRHKTIAFVGDSLARQQFQSLMCMVTGGIHNRKVEDVGKEYGLVKAAHAKRPDGWAYRFQNTNTTILFYWSACLCELQPLNNSDPRTHYAMHIDRPVAFIRLNLHKFDVLVLNTGHHWSRWKFKENRWNLHINGKPDIGRKLAGIASAKNLTIHSVVQWLDSQLPQHPRLRAFFRTISPRHFVNGDWNTGGNCDNIVPLTGGSEVMHDGSNDLVAEAAVKGTRVELLDITALSQLRDEGHISKYFSKSSDGFHDCLHWCLPGIPDTWNEILSAQL